MKEITLQKTYDLLEKLAEYVMTEVPTRCEMNAGFQQVYDVMDRRFKQVEKRFKQIDKRFEQVDRRFEQVDRRFEQVDRRFEQVDKRFEQIDKRFKQVDRRFEQVDKHFQFIEYQLTEKADSKELEEVKKKFDSVIISIDAIIKK
jgi:archaellum component FlaC